MNGPPTNSLTLVTNPTDEDMEQCKVAVASSIILHATVGAPPGDDKELQPNHCTCVLMWVGVIHMLLVGLKSLHIARCYANILARFHPPM